MKLLDCAIMPEMLKIAQMCPLLKKTNLDHEVFKNFETLAVMFMHNRKDDIGVGEKVGE